MTLKTTRYIRKPLGVDAVQVTDENIKEVAAWCNGVVDVTTRNSSDSPYIRVPVMRPGNVRQTQAYVGDWVLRADNHVGTYKVYTQKSFAASFELAVN